MRYVQHDAALNAAEKAVKVETNARDQKYIIIIYDGPKSIQRDASFISNVSMCDVVQVCRAIADQTKEKAN
jgi:hypothetical protein